MDLMLTPPIAREMMSSPVRTIRPDATLAEAQRLLLHYGHSGLLSQVTWLLRSKPLRRRQDCPKLNL